MILELNFWKERNLNRFWYCIRQKLATVIDIVIAKCCQHVLILVLLLQSDAGKYWYWYWYCRLEAVAIDIDIERKFSLSHSPGSVQLRPDFWLELMSRTLGNIGCSASEQLCIWGEKILSKWNANVLTTLFHFVIYFEIAQVQYQKVHCNKCRCSSVEKKETIIM